MATRGKFQTSLGHTHHNSGQVTVNELTLPESKNVRRALTVAEVRRLMSQLTQPYQLMAEWAVATGMRRMELCALRLYQIPESMHLRQRDSKTFLIPLIITKGNRPRDVHPPLLLLDRTHRYINETREQVVRAQRKHDSSYILGMPCSSVCGDRKLP